MPALILCSRTRHAPLHLTHCTRLPQHLGAQLTSRDPSACAAAAHVLANILRHIPSAAATICDTPDIASLLLLHLKIDAAATPAALAVATSSLHLLAALALTPDGCAPRPQHHKHLSLPITVCCTRAMTRTLPQIRCQCRSAPGVPRSLRPPRQTLRFVVCNCRSD